MVVTLPQHQEDGDSHQQHTRLDQARSDNQQHGSNLAERRGSCDQGNNIQGDYDEEDGPPDYEGHINPFTTTTVTTDKVSPERGVVQSGTPVSHTLQNSLQNLPSSENGNSICSIDNNQMTETGAQENSCGMQIVVTQDKADDNNKPVRGQKFRKRSFASMKSGSINSGSVNSDSSGGYLAGSSLTLGLPDCSDFERVWETAPEVIIKAARLASAETLTPSDASSFSSLPHVQPYESPLKTPPTAIVSSAEPILNNPFSNYPSALIKSYPENVDNEDDLVDNVNKQPCGSIDDHEDGVNTDHSCGDIMDDIYDAPKTFTDHYFSQPQLYNLDAPEKEDWSCDNQSIEGEVGGIDHACSCGVNLEENYIGKHCSACMVPNPVYYSEQFPSNDLLEDFDVDGSNHMLHVDLTTGQVKLHLHVHHKCGMPPTDTAQAYIDNKCPKCPNNIENNVKDLPSTSTHPPENKPKKLEFCKPFGFSSGIGEPSIYHALVVIFLEFFAWGLLTAPMIAVLNETFPDHTFLMNGLIVGIKGILSFLSAPLIGALSDVWGRKFFLFITVFFTCLPIPFMKINTWWYFALISMSGVFAVTFSIVFAYVADVTDPEDRSAAYGLVSATFAASLVTSPALGAYLGKVHSDDLVVGLATAIAILDVFFILVAVPESLPEKLRLSSTWSANITWEQADPFTALWKVSKDRNVLLISLTVFLSYLPEAGQYSCFFVYLRLVMGFSPEMVATFIAVIGILSVVAQTAFLSLLMKKLSNKKVIIVGLVFELLQLMWYGFGSQMWMMWAAGLLASVSSITYPAISAYVSTHTEADKQGVVQGIITGMRGLCSGLGPAVYGLIFYLFHVDLNDEKVAEHERQQHRNGTVPHRLDVPNLIPGPPFVFGAFMVICALMVSVFIPEPKEDFPKRRKASAVNSEVSYERRSQGHKKKDSLDAASLPLMEESGIL